MSQAPRSAYVHVPFCAHRCGYCDFAIVAGRADLAGDYLRAIELEMRRQAPEREVDTLYFGGGTPSQLSPGEFDQLCRLAHAWRPLAPNFEWTVEANPSDVTPDRVAQFASWGVTRLSLGGQSFNAEKLGALERDHSADDIHRSVELAHAAGIEACLDLIFAAPGETLPQWRLDLDRAIDLRPQHLSTYGLTYEKGTSFWSRLKSGGLEEVEEERQRGMYLEAIERLNQAGYEHYEVSNFAQPGRYSRHNLAYWSGSGCYAVGPGATRFVDSVRETNHRSTTTYLRRVLSGDSAVAEREELDDQQRAREALVFGLRRISGVDLEDFEARTGFRVDCLAGGPIKKFVGLGLLEEQGGALRLTKEGLLVSDALWPELL